MNNKENNKSIKGRVKTNKRIITIGIVVALLAAVVAGGVYLKNRGGGDNVDSQNVLTHTASRTDLIISVTETGDIKAIKSTDTLCEVEGRTTIIGLVDEGYRVTQEDIDNKKILVQLDSSQIEQDLSQQEVSFSNASASYAEAQESRAIQIKQNESDIQAGEMKARFALMDFRKYLGEDLANEIVTEANDVENLSDIDFQELLADPRLGGEAQQKISQLTSDIELANSKLERAVDRLDGTKELFKEGYVAETDLKADELDAQSSKAQVERAEIALELFKAYEFPKETERLLSEYRESLRELDRILARTRSKLAQEEAQLRNRKLTYELQERRLNKLRDQLEACTVEATAVGQVVYGSSLLDRRRRSREPIEMGAEVRERQTLISIPDTSKMKVDVSIPENWIGKVEVGQHANIKISAFPDMTFTGKVITKAPLAAPEDWWNPDRKVYVTQVSIDGSHDFIKTGMSAVVSIIIDKVEDVITVPVQSVATRGRQQYCYVLTNRGPEMRIVKTGSFNADFVEIVEGLQEGEKVLLVPLRVDDKKALKAGLEEEKPEPERGDRPGSDMGQGRRSRRGPSENQDNQGRDQQQNRPNFSQIELTEERINQIMQGISQFDPTNYERLNKLRQENPEKFKEELRKQMQQFMQRRPEAGQSGQGQRPNRQNRNPAQ